MNGGPAGAADDLTRRRLLAGLAASATALAAGCQALFGSDGDLLIRNRSPNSKRVTVIMDRGGSYTPKLESVRIRADDRSRIDGFFPRSDWPYPFLLHFYVDGEYRRTTEHRWDDLIEASIRPDGTLTAEETDRRVSLTPQVRDRTVRRGENASRSE